MKVLVKKLLAKVLTVLGKNIVYTIVETKAYSVGANNLAVVALNTTYSQSPDCMSITVTLDHDYIMTGINKAEGKVDLYNHYTGTQSGTVTITYFMKA